MVLERIQSEIIIVEGLHVGRMNSYRDRADGLLLIVAYNVLSISPTVAADDQEAIRQIELFDCHQNSSNCHSLTEADDDISIIVFIHVLHQFEKLFVLVVAQNLRNERKSKIFFGKFISLSHRVFPSNANSAFICELTKSLNA